MERRRKKAVFLVTEKVKPNQFIVEERDDKNFLICRYDGYYNPKNESVSLYPKRGERHYRAEKKIVSLLLLHFGIV